MTPEMILAAIVALEKLAEIIAKAVQTAKQSKELTPEQEADFDQRLAALRTAPHWQPRS